MIEKRGDEVREDCIVLKRTTIKRKEKTNDKDKKK